MTIDPILAEIRAVREQYAARFNYDLEAICNDLREQEKRRGVKGVTLSPRPTATAAADSEDRPK